VVDLALVAFPVSGRDFRKIPLFEEDFVIVLPAGHRLAGRASIRIKELADEPFILYRQGTNARKTIDRLLHKARFGPRVVMELNDTEAIKEMVANGFGVSLVPASAFLTRTPSKQVTSVAIKGGGAKRAVGLIYLRSRTLSPATKALMQRFQSHYAKRASVGARDRKVAR
jgi:DNA-binding transcriptional LysR family regulator